ncbi:tetratricopeptide repeat-containing glycosyltransferase [Ottowia thiooxydans]|uniref:tetratricopeptide repeat-containing glycosyltransferase n=1 Tax=Ottowia thiooxydans TaxID=219182 RepID=UPI0006863368|nr:glycosyltransferase family 2 protein [Ottowia thiooxydans]
MTTTTIRSSRPRVCLNMIVKNEAALIERCLSSVLPLIDSWVIFDTGSTDGTQALIQKSLAHLPGELHERPWVNFGHNRTEAVVRAQSFSREKCPADYVLFFDADDVMHVPQGFKWPALNTDACYLWLQLGDTRYTRVMMVSTRLQWKWVGVLHEYPEATPPSQTLCTVEGPWVAASTEGARSADPRKYHKDAEVLMRALEMEPDSTRYRFYLAQSLRDAGEPEAALQAYLRRAELEGFSEERWYALYQAALLSERLQKPWPEVVQRYLEAYEARPQRAEALVELARAERLQGHFSRAYLFASQACRTPRPADILFVDESAYAWRAADELSISAYWTGRYEESLSLCEALLKQPATPAEHRERIHANLEHAKRMLRERSGQV